MTTKLITTYNPPPIPIRHFDWTCIDENYEGGDIIGTGETEEAAIADYWEKKNVRSKAKNFK